VLGGSSLLITWLTTLVSPPLGTPVAPLILPIVALREGSLALAAFERRERRAVAREAFDRSSRYMIANSGPLDDAVPYSSQCAHSLRHL
jgi:hypothetical protein